MMSKEDTPNVDERLATLEVDVSALKDRLTVITQAIGDPRVGGITPAFQAPAFLTQAIFQGFPLALSRLLLAPFSFPKQPIAGPCNMAQAVINIGGPGSYQLLVSVAPESDCSVIVNDPAGIVGIGPVAPGNSLLSKPFSGSLNPQLIATCQGSGNCKGEITLIQLP